MRYVYGVVRDGTPPPTARGVGSPPAPVQVVGSPPIAAAVSTVPEGYEVTEADASAHLDVLVDLLGRGPVIPVRLGSVVPDDAAVRTEVLDVDRDTFIEALEALDGLVEVHVDADEDETSAIASIVAAGDLPPAGGDLSQRIALGEMIADRLVARRRSLAEQLLAALRPVAVADAPRAELRGPEDPVLRWSFLVRDLDAFDDVVAALRSSYAGVTFEYVGPLPAAHFVGWRGGTAVSSEPDSFSGSGRWSW